VITDPISLQVTSDPEFRVSNDADGLSRPKLYMMVDLVTRPSR